MPRTPNLRTGAWIVVSVVVVVAVGAEGSSTFLNFLIGVVLWAVIGVAWNLMLSIGYLSLATAAWYGLGAYSTAVLMNHFHLDFYASVVLSGLWIGLLAAVTVVPMLRLRSHYFIMGTFIVAEILAVIASQLKVFGLQGGTGIDMPIPPGGAGIGMYRYFLAVSLVLLAATAVGVRWLRRGRSGLAIKALGQDEDAASSLGVAAVRYKLLLFGFSSAIIAMAGGVDAYWVGYVVRETFFSIDVTIKGVIVGIIGGGAGIVGPMVGSLILQFIVQVLGANLATLSEVVYGLLVIVVVIAMPEGLVPAVERIIRAGIVKIVGAPKVPDNPGQIESSNGLAPRRFRRSLARSSRARGSGEAE